MKTIRQQIEERYKPGVSFHPVNGAGIVLTQKVYTVQEDWILRPNASGDQYCTFIDKCHDYMHRGYIYANGQFAPIVETNTPTQKVQPENKYPRTMLVWDDGVDNKMETKIVADFYVDGRKYFVNVAFHVWQNAEEIPEKTKVTLSEALQIVAEKLGKSVNEIEIEKFTQDELHLLWAGKKATCDKDCHCHAECPVADEYIKELKTN